MRKKICFFVFLSRIVSNFERYIFRLLAKTLQKFSKLSSACPEEPFVAWIFFKFWIVSDFLQKPLTWFSKFYLRVQSKICGKNSFFCFSFHNFFFEFWAIYFQIFGQNNSKVFKTIFCVSRGTICAFNFFFKSFEPLWNFCRNLWHGSQISIYVSGVKFAEEIIFFWSSLLNFFEIWAKIFQTFGSKNFKKFSKLYSTCPGEQFVAWYSSAWFSKFYLRVQSKNFGRNSFLIFLFGIFFRILSEIFFRLPAKNLQKVVKTIFWVSRGTICGLK